MKAAHRVRREAAPEKARIARIRDLAAQPTLLSTAAKHGLSFFDALVMLTTNHPWMPDAI